MNAINHAMEHRWGDRITLHAPAEVWSASGPNQPASIINASLSGALLTTATPLPQLAQLSVRLVPDGEWLEACVVRSEQGSMAVEWLDPGIRPLNALQPGQHRQPDQAGPEANSTLQKSVEKAAVDRARSELDSGEFDVQG